MSFSLWLGFLVAGTTAFVLASLSELLFFAWSAVALLWCIPVFGTLAKTGIWAALAMFFAWSFYWRASRSLGLGMLAWFVLLAWLTRWLHASLT